MNKSFTLIEILVVIVVIGIISAFILVGMSSINNSASIAKGKAYANSLRNTLLLSLVSEWKLDGNGNDSWGANNGTLVGATHFPVLKSGSDCVSASCYQFDGTEDYIDIGDKDNLSFTDNVFTFSIRINATRTNNLGILGKRGIWEYSIFSTSSDLKFYCWNSAGTAVYSGSSSVDVNKWTHFVWTASGTYNYVYKNGVYSSASPKSSNNMNNTAAFFRIGHGGDGGGQQFMSGMIDEVVVYNGYTTISQVRQMFYSGLNKLLVKNIMSKKEYMLNLAQTLDQNVKF